MKRNYYDTAASQNKHAQALLIESNKYEMPDLKMPNWQWNRISLLAFAIAEDYEKGETKKSSTAKAKKARKVWNKIHTYEETQEKKGNRIRGKITLIAHKSRYTSLAYLLDKKKKPMAYKFR